MQIKRLARDRRVKKLNLGEMSSPAAKSLQFYPFSSSRRLSRFFIETFATAGSRSTNRTPLR